tara:strand:+ start:14484 stop:15866 length:1383 start_codon:yes stop_codon:yes gene_type:complete
MAEYLRYIRGLTGTKIVCAEGDCGACSVLVSRIHNDQLSPYQSINACIAKMYLYEGCHILTVEGLGKAMDLHPVQEVFVDEQGAQCGYCTPGFICAMAGLAEDLKIKNQKPCAQKVKNYLTGNLCRCTGYEPIIQAGLKLDLENTPSLKDLYRDEDILADYKKEKPISIKITGPDQEIFLPKTIDEALAYKTHEVKMISGATDLGVVTNKGKLKLNKTLSLNNIENLYQVEKSDHFYTIGAKVNLTELEKKLSSDFPEFARLLHIFASPQIKNAATLVGNLVNASPIADTIPFLMVSGAKVRLQSQKGLREVEIKSFFKGGYKELDLRDDEIVTAVIIPRTQDEYKLYKVSVRKDLDISVVTFAAGYKLQNNQFESLRLALGGVGPIVITPKKLEQNALGKNLGPKLFQYLAQEVEHEITPMTDHRGSDQFRYQLARNLMIKFGDEILKELNPSQFEASI